MGSFTTSPQAMQHSDSPLMQVPHFTAALAAAAAKYDTAPPAVPSAAPPDATPAGKEVTAAAGGAKTKQKKAGKGAASAGTKGAAAAGEKGESGGVRQLDPNRLLIWQVRLSRAISNMARPNSGRFPNMASPNGRRIPNVASPNRSCF